MRTATLCGFRAMRVTTRAGARWNWTWGRCCLAFQKAARLRHPLLRTDKNVTCSSNLALVAQVPKRCLYQVRFLVAPVMCTGRTISACLLASIHQKLTGILVSHSCKSLCHRMPPVAAFSSGSQFQLAAAQATKRQLRLVSSGNSVKRRHSVM